MIQHVRSEARALKVNQLGCYKQTWFSRACAKNFDHFLYNSQRTLLTLNQCTAHAVFDPSLSRSELDLRTPEEKDATDRAQRDAGEIREYLALAVHR